MILNLPVSLKTNITQLVICNCDLLLSAVFWKKLFTEGKIQENLVEIVVWLAGWHFALCIIFWRHLYWNKSLSQPQLSFRFDIIPRKKNLGKNLLIKSCLSLHDGIFLCQLPTFTIKLYRVTSFINTNFHQIFMYIFQRKNFFVIRSAKYILPRNLHVTIIEGCI